MQQRTGYHKLPQRTTGYNREQVTTEKTCYSGKQLATNYRSQRETGQNRLQFVTAYTEEQVIAGYSRLQVTAGFKFQQFTSYRLERESVPSFY